MEQIMSARNAPQVLRGVTVAIVTFGMVVPLAHPTPQNQPLATPEEATDSLLKSGMESLKAERYKEAEDAFRKVLGQDPENARATIGVVQVYRAQARYDDALHLLEAGIKSDPARLDYHLAMGDIAMRSGMNDLALREFLGVLKRIDKFSRAAGDLYFRIGEIYSRKGELDFSIIFLKQAKELQPRNALILATLATALDRAGQKQAADVTYRSALEADANNAGALNNLAFLLSENGGDLDVALAYAERARQLYPNRPAVADTLGWVYLKKNKIDEATAILRDVVRQNPDQAVYRYHLSVALDRGGDHAAAIEELKKALESSPSKEEEQKIREFLAKISK
jgi:tetratricopeptide (TPR) repeat protein